ncbi:PepSY domain-containing protein [Chryseosolibacter indicus]|uniref:PepSY domain-containing protein n=1 Tax=Chryseosolibacter indicus TaxID=2782351 RepID=A0ABS5VTF2_9BACT|nr:PepSY domain-containing protein [Chryseosolibacter indicus]MBT1704107.1 PepSY domain-containing protein [Chryseosolibacter indicus]
MTLSVWRYAHLALALFSFIFLALASVTGVILAVDAVRERASPYRADNIENISLTETLTVLRKAYPEITEISVDHNQHIVLQGVDANGDDVEAYINPRTGALSGKPEKKSDFIQWITALHRSLFLHEAGRFFIGLNAFLLMLISVSGIALIIQRQEGIRRFFSRIVKDDFAQYYHVVTGRLALIPIFIIALSGTYLSLVRFNLLPQPKINHEVETVASDSPSEKNIADFAVFSNTMLSEVRKIEFPFSDDPDEYYVLKLKDREMVIDQFTGNVLSNVQYPFTALLETLSLDLHTGRTSIVWAIVLAIASLNILFFIYSGFSMTVRRIATRITNKHKPHESEFILLVGSENGSTLRFANAIHQQLLANKRTSFLAELNNYAVFPKAKHLVVFTSTHGLGHAPSNANKLVSLLSKNTQTQSVYTSVVGFGSHAYPDFCGYARTVDEVLARQPWAEPLVTLHTVDDKSPLQFTQWVKAWNEKTGLSLTTAPALYNGVPEGLRKMHVLEKTMVASNDETFLLTLKPDRKTVFTSGDLLAIYPDNNGKERLYSISKSKGNIQLAVKLHPSGSGSRYLYDLNPGAVISARIVHNKGFHFPQPAPAVALIANGTGIAPFLGMVEQNKKKTEVHLYCGFRRRTELIQRYEGFADEYMQKQHLKTFNIAFSQEENHCYVMDLIKRDAKFFVNLLAVGGVVMICGSLAMLQDVEATLDQICIKRFGAGIATYKSSGQVVADCY